MQSEKYVKTSGGGSTDVPLFCARPASPANCVVCQNEKKKKRVGERKKEKKKMPITATHHPEIGKVTELRTSADRGEKKALQN